MRERTFTARRAPAWLPDCTSRLFVFLIGVWIGSALFDLAAHHWVDAIDSALIALLIASLRWCQLHNPADGWWDVEER